jgi:hypothetical protein
MDKNMKINELTKKWNYKSSIKGISTKNNIRQTDIRFEIKDLKKKF